MFCSSITAAPHSQRQSFQAVLILPCRTRKTWVSLTTRLLIPSLNKLQTPEAREPHSYPTVQRLSELELSSVGTLPVPVRCRVRLQGENSQCRLPWTDAGCLSTCAGEGELECSGCGIRYHSPKLGGRTGDGREVAGVESWVMLGH